MNNSTSDQIRQRIDAFVQELDTLIRQNALETLRGALGDGRVSSRGRRSVRRGPRKAVGRGGRRSSADVDSTAAALLSHIKQQPGQTISELGSALNASAKELRLPVLKLLQERQIKTTGQRRGTRYHPGGGRRMAKAKRRRAKGRRRGRSAKAA